MDPTGDETFRNPSTSKLNEESISLVKNYAGVKTVQIPLMDFSFYKFKNSCMVATN